MILNQNRDKATRWKHTTRVVDEMRHVAVECRVDGVRVVGARVEVQVKKVRATLFV